MGLPTHSVGRIAVENRRYAYTPFLAVRMCLNGYRLQTTVLIEFR